MAKTKNPNVNNAKAPGYVGAVDGEQGAGFTVVDDGGHDVAWAYAFLSDGEMPPVIRGEDLEDF